MEGNLSVEQMMIRFPITGGIIEHTRKATDFPMIFFECMEDIVQTVRIRMSNEKIIVNSTLMILFPCPLDIIILLYTVSA